MKLKFRTAQTVSVVILLVSLAGIYAVYAKMFKNFTNATAESFNLVVNVMLIFVAVISLMFIIYTAVKSKSLIDAIPEIDERIENNASYLSYDVVNMLPDSKINNVKVKPDVHLENIVKKYFTVVFVAVVSAGGALIVLALQKL